MRLFQFGGYDEDPCIGEFVVYPSGCCLVIKDIYDPSRIVLRMDEDGFGKFVRALREHLTTRKTSETTIHGFEVRFSNRHVSISGTVMLDQCQVVKQMPFARPSRFPGSMGLYLGEKIEEFAHDLEMMAGDGLKLWSSANKGKYTLALLLTHKLGLELAMLQDGNKTASQGLVFEPTDLVSGLTMMFGSTVKQMTVTLENPWHSSLLDFARQENGMVSVTATGHLTYGVDEYKLLVETNMQRLVFLRNAILSYFRGGKV